MNYQISIIVPCYNQAQYLDECLQSVLNQTYPNWECIIVNDGSPDNTEEVAKVWLKKDERFKYVKKENGGLSSARNAGIMNAQGKYILPLDADDKISVDYVNESIEVFKENPETALVYCDACLFGCEEGLWELPQYNYIELFFGNHIFCSAIFKKEDWSKIGGYDEEMKKGFEDWDFWLRLLGKDSKVIRLPIIGFFYRKKECSMITELVKDGSKIKEITNYIFKKQMHIIGDYLECSYPEIISNYLRMKQEIYFLKNDYTALAKQVKISNLFRATFLKFLFCLRNTLKKINIFCLK